MQYLRNYLLQFVCMFGVLISLNSQAQMVIESLSGPVTQNEIDAAKSYIKTLAVPGDASTTSNLAYGTNARIMEGIGKLYELTKDKEFLDVLLKMTDKTLKLRNDPNTGTIDWTGQRELIWHPEEVRTGAEQGLIVGKIAYAAQLILQSPWLWNLTVASGNPYGYGATYKQRAQRYVDEMELTESTYMFKWFVRSTDKQLIHPNDSRYDGGTPGGHLPFNQKWMIAMGKMRMSKCYEILGNATMAAKYKEVVQVCLNLYASQMYPATYQGYPAYIWYYPANNTQYIEDIDHGGMGMMAMMNMYLLGGYTGFPDQTKMGNAIMYAVYRPASNDWNHNVAGTNSTWHSDIKPAYMWLSRSVSNLYATIANDLIREDLIDNQPDAISYVLWAKNARYTGNWTAGMNNGPSGVLLYQGCNYTGWAAAFSEGSYTLADMQALGAINDDASSLRIPSGYTVTLYSENNFTGSSITLTADDACLIDNSFNDKISSMRVSTNGVTLYHDCPYTGTSAKFGVGNYLLSDLNARGISNDAVSSLEIASGYTVTLYENDNFTGSSLILTADNSCLTAQAFNDKVSSMKVTYSGANLRTRTSEANEALATTESEEKLTLKGYPNPVTQGKVTIQYALAEASHVNIKVKAANGDDIATLVNEYKPAGNFAIIWDTSSSPQGMYLVRMLCGQKAKTIKLVIGK